MDLLGRSIDDVVSGGYDTRPDENFTIVAVDTSVPLVYVGNPKDGSLKQVTYYSNSGISLEPGSAEAVARHMVEKIRAVDSTAGHEVIIYRSGQRRVFSMECPVNPSYQYELNYPDPVSPMPAPFDKGGAEWCLSIVGGLSANLEAERAAYKARATPVNLSRADLEELFISGNYDASVIGSFISDRGKNLRLFADVWEAAVRSVVTHIIDLDHFIDRGIRPNYWCSGPDIDYVNDPAYVGVRRAAVGKLQEFGKLREQDIPNIWGLKKDEVFSKGPPAQLVRVEPYIEPTVKIFPEARAKSVAARLAGGQGFKEDYYKEVRRVERFYVQEVVRTGPFGWFRKSVHTARTRTVSETVELSLEEVLAKIRV